MAKLKYPFVTYPATEGGYVAEIPALKGCLAQGETLTETLDELETVETLWLETAKQAGVRVPRILAEIDRVKEKLAA
ncbi:MAG TPA: type II toxin-antitoxin system HicB family antitoxin [Pyrinomonadaceae bacterium]|nr:type II toxin-antitoxin system HicB family antitoxin [Pyrinomonadaceae bacterium]